MPEISPISSPVMSETTTAEGHVVLPFGREAFRDFIRSLLGAPQSITRNISGSFELGRDDLLGFHHLLMQRIQQQNEAGLIQFRTKVVFSDNSTVTNGIKLASFPAVFRRVSPYASFASPP